MELRIISRLSSNICKLFGIHYTSRCYSLYPQYFVEPIIDKEEVKKVLKEKEPIEIELLAVKAANNYATTSVFFDSDVHLMSQILMRRGNRKLAKSLVDKALEHIKRLQVDSYHKQSSEKNIELDPRKIFHKAIENCTPILGTKKVVRSGTTYIIPSVVVPRKAKFLAMKFLIEAASEKKQTERFYVHLAKQLIEASQNKGNAVQKKVDLHKYCEANRAYAHYRWA